MHSIKSAARRLAWKDDSYNPFSRSRSRQSYYDEETGLQRSQSEPKHRQQRSIGGTVGPSNIEGVHHASTAPPVSAISEHPHEELPLPNEKVGETPQSQGQSENTSGASNATDHTLVSGEDVQPPVSEVNTGPRQRRSKFKPWKKEPSSPDSEDEKPKPQKFTVWGQIRVVVFGSWVNLLLVAIPAGFAVHFTHANPFAIFFINFLAIVPLAGMLSYATEEIAMRTGETIGGLLNATFGNAVELIVAIIALTQNKIIIVQTSLIGSMLSNLLLVMGMCFFFGGISRVEQYFNVTVAQTAASLAALAIGSLLVPTAFDAANTNLGAQSTQEAAISRGTAIVLLVVYACYLFFQLKTHIAIYNEPSQKAPKRNHVDEGATQRNIAQMAAGSAAASGGQINQENLVQEDDDEPEQPQLSFIGALVTLGISTTLVALCAEFMTSSINDITATGAIGTEFVGLILLPIVGNAAEHATAVTVACKDKMDLAIGVAIGSSMQIALLVLPLAVVLGWIIGTPTIMTLDFDYFQITVLFVAILLVNYLIQDGKSHWLEGVLLMATYIIIAVAAWFYPNNADLIG